ncbi:diaminobutyrate--2-oxoglutarate transaminase [Duganella sp. CT11-25]|uniref:diaminobutyrate--2-oxoglutarate transaminase n=1 Tax=unclassified Duganella TaxID=2636909 RepID=UPI0039AFDA5C
MNIFTELESSARSYCRRFPKVFSRAVGSVIYDEDDTPYLDFLSCAGAVNYGHNHPQLKRALCDYILADGIQAALDLHTRAKRDFIGAFRELILAPRQLDYRLQFTSPTGTSTVESAVKLARKLTGRQNVIAFTNAFHGMSGTALGLTGNRYHRQRGQDAHVTRIPYDGYLGAGIDSLDLLEKLLSDTSSGIDLPAAIIVETIQGEGGVNLASRAWLQRLRRISDEFKVLLIVDDIQAGCGRSGQFFSFEFADIVPDMVCLSKSLSGYGLPMSLLLIAPASDQWLPAEDNGTFRGNTMAFVTATAALREFWADQRLLQHIAEAEQSVVHILSALKSKHGALIKEVRGRGLFYGIEFHQPEAAAAVAEDCFAHQLIIERCGSLDQVIKVFPALTIDSHSLRRGLEILAAAVGRYASAMPAPALESAVL